MGEGKGKWVFVPAGHRAKIEPVQDRPPEFYSLLRSQIACQLFLRDIRPDLYDYCITNAVLPPPRLRKWRLEKWIEDHRTGARAVVSWEKSRADCARERQEFFRAVAARSEKKAGLRRPNFGAAKHSAAAFVRELARLPRAADGAL